MWKGYDSERIIDVNGNLWIYVEDWNCWQKQKRFKTESERKAEQEKFQKEFKNVKRKLKVTVNMGGVQ